MTDEPEFLELFRNGDVAAAKDWLAEHPLVHEGYEANELLRQCVSENNGQCHKQSQLHIAELLLPEVVKDFRTAVLENNCPKINKLLSENTGIAHAEFTGIRGIGQAIHCFVSKEAGQFLIDSGAKIDVLNTRNETPLAMQCRFGSEDAIRLLLDRGANPNVGPCPHFPSAVLAERIELLQKYGWEIGAGQLLHDAKHGSGQRIRTWLHYGVDPNTSSEEGQNALHILAIRGLAESRFSHLPKPEQTSTPEIAMENHR